MTEEQNELLNILLHYDFEDYYARLEHVQSVENIRRRQQQFHVTLTLKKPLIVTNQVLKALGDNKQLEKYFRREIQYLVRDAERRRTDGQ
jgi:hypothetical protein